MRRFGQNRVKRVQLIARLLENPVDLWKWTTSLSLDQRKWLVGKLETQALLGQSVTVIEEQGEWAKVAVHGQPTPKSDLGYVAWMPKTQLSYEL